LIQKLQKIKPWLLGGQNSFQMLRTRYAQTMIIFNEIFKLLTLACKT